MLKNREEKMQKWYVRTVWVDRDRRFPIISGKTLREAVEKHIELLFLTCIKFPRKSSDIALEQLRYEPGILGNKGGMVARIRYVNARNQIAYVESWIYADENGNPKGVI